MLDWRLIACLALGLLLGHILIVVFDALLGIVRQNRPVV